ncbi:MAG TPA: 2-C-methyl-D-erythritol 4-phosphate cytidylyltransferase [Candidatus Limnocylindria bacterium]|nr:2-C-methyl-D-erythritol 4-phosphate cytidylyltransferase [Candidatus Limnocylindria bacterium]
MTYAIVPAGGLGTRMGSRRPKQYLRLGRVPILVATLRALGRARGIAGVVVAVPEAHVVETRRLLARLRVPRILEVVAGGADRQESVWRALQRIPEQAERVVVHDAVRPFIDAALVARVLGAAAAGGAATCGIPVRETVKRVTDGAIEATIPRRGLWLTQTPQAFTRALLWEAHDKARRDGFAGTDDAVLVERLGVTVAMVQGLGQNLKITTPEDLQTARAWAAPRRRG